jgi:hypothetical protein
MNRRLSSILLAFQLFTPVLGRSETRLAVVPSDDSMRPAADLLTAAFTDAPDVALVERVEVGKLLAEHHLTSTRTQDFARLGHMLRADGLVLLQPLVSAKGTNLAVRLVAVNNGVVLGAVLFPLPLKDTDKWGEFVAKKFAPLLPKLAVTRSQAVPISFLNLRSAASTSTSAQTERSLNALLYHRLTQQPELFVLERKEMGRLEWEKNLAGPDEGQFWNGSYLLEGTIDRDGPSPDTMTIHARLMPPGQQMPVELT